MAKSIESKLKFTFVTVGDKAQISAHKKVRTEIELLVERVKKLEKQIKLQEAAIKDLNPVVKKSAKIQQDLGQAYQKTTASQKVLNKETDITYRNNRNLLGSFSVLRSKLLLATFAMTALSRTVGRFVKESADVEETLNKFNVVFGRSRDRALEFSETLAEGVGRSKFMLQEMLATLQDTFVPLGFARDKSADLSMALTKLAVDVASFQNKADDEVVKAFTSALVGNHEAVRAYGITITQAQLKQAALQKGIIDTEREMTSQEKVLARLVVIHGATRDAEDDALKTKESYTNQLKAFNAQLEELRIRIGDTIEPFAALLLKLAGHFANVAVLKGYASALGVVAAGFILANIQAKRFLFNLAAMKLALARTGIGILVVGVGELAARTIFADDALKDLNDSIDDTVPSLDDMIESMKGARIAMEGMNRAVAEGKISYLDTEILRAAGDLEKLERISKEHSVRTSEIQIGALIELAKQYIFNLEKRRKALSGYLEETLAKEEEFQEARLKMSMSELGFKIHLLDKEMLEFEKAGVDLKLLQILHNQLKAKLIQESEDKIAKIRKASFDKLIRDADKAAKKVAKIELKALKDFQKLQEKKAAELKKATDIKIAAESDINLKIKKLILSDLAFKKHVLKLEKEEYEKKEVDKNLLAKWYRAQLFAITKEHLDKIEKAEKESLDKIKKQKQQDSDEEEAERKKLEKKQIALSESVSLRMSELIDSELDYKLKALTAQYDKEIALAGDNVMLLLELQKWYLEEKKKLTEDDEAIAQQKRIDGINQLISSFSGVGSAYSQMVQGQLSEDLNRLKSSSAYEQSTMEQREIMEQKIRNKHRGAAKTAANMEKAAKVASSIMNTYEAYTKALALFPLNPIFATTIAALGAAQTALILATPTGYAKGGEFITSGKEMIMVGDNPSGREHVKVTPLPSTSNVNNSTSSSITINISAPLVDETVIDTIIPAIQKAQRLNLA
ncbi:hypothetical protein [uncultured Mediterranean phage uvDeep-CGR2-KM18-C269]|nr:hypothetical protein [uncultured Mediterranean phage uvDeep-CGR2-KM18-C269]